MSSKFIFDLTGGDRHRDLPARLVVGRRENEGPQNIVLKLLAFLVLHRERLEINGDVRNENIAFEPDVLQLDYTLRPVLWVECGNPTASKLHKLAVKVPDAEIWVMKPDLPGAEALVAQMRKEELRTDRYDFLVFEPGMVEEMCGLLAPRNTLFWMDAEWTPPRLQLDFNGLWFDAPFTRFRY